MLWNKYHRFIIWYKCFFLFIGWEPTTWPANNCLQIMVCSCAMLFNCFILFYSCVNETTLFSFLRSLLHENGRLLCFLKIFLEKQARWSNDKTIIELGHRKISWFVSVSQITTDKSQYFAQPHPIIVNCSPLKKLLIFVWIGSASSYMAFLICWHVCCSFWR